MDTLKLIDFIVIFFSAVFSSFGLGGGSIYLLYLTFYKKLTQKNAQGLNLMFFLPVAVCSVVYYLYKKVIQPRKIWPIVLGGILGVFLGAFLLQYVKTKYLKIIFSIFLIGTGLKMLLQKKTKESIE